MLHLLDLDPHGRRLRELLHRFRAEEAGLRHALDQLEAALEECHRQASRARLVDPDAPLQLDHCRQLQTEHDDLAIELVHVRLAVAGAAEELAEYETARRGERMLTPA
jgi:hypothetical protein